MERQKISNIVDLASVAGAEQDGKFYPCARLSNKNGHYPRMTPLLMAGFCISLYEAFMALIPDKELIKFENEFKEIFVKSFDAREDYMIRDKHEKPTLIQKIASSFKK